MALRNVKHFDATKVYDTSGLGGQTGPNPNQVASYRANSGAEVDQGLSPAVDPAGFGDHKRKRYRSTQVSVLQTTESPGTHRDEFDLPSAYLP